MQSGRAAHHGKDTLMTDCETAVTQMRTVKMKLLNGKGMVMRQWRDTTSALHPEMYTIGHIAGSTGSEIGFWARGLCVIRMLG